MLRRVEGAFMGHVQRRQRYNAERTPEDKPPEAAGGGIRFNHDAGSCAVGGVAEYSITPHTLRQAESSAAATLAIDIADVCCYVTP